MAIQFAQVGRIKPSKSKDYFPGYPPTGMTTVDSLMMNRGYVIPAKAGIQGIEG